MKSLWLAAVLSLWMAGAGGVCPGNAAEPGPGADESRQDQKASHFVAQSACGALDKVLGLIPADARALVLVDARLHVLIARALNDYLTAAARRRQFRVVLIPIEALDDCRPEQVREALQQWHAGRPGVEGVLFVGNVKLPSFFMPRVDIHSIRLWPRFFEDLDMTPLRRIPAGTVLKNEPEPGQSRPRIEGAKSLTVGPHDYDELEPGKLVGPELWAAFLPVGFQEGNTYEDWAGQLSPFFTKAAAFHKGTVKYGRGLYLVSNDIGLLARSRPVWDAIGPKGIEFFAINEKGPGAFKTNSAGYQRAALEKYATLDAFLEYAKGLPWMDEGWQSAVVFLAHMAQARRRVVWWNVHSNPEWSLVSWQQAREIKEGGLIALLNGCSVGGYRQPGSPCPVDTQTTPEQNILANLVYGKSAFIAALGSTHDRVTDERVTPFCQHLYNGGYLGKAHFLRLRQADQDVQNQPRQLREFQEVLIGDPFADAEDGATALAPQPMRGWAGLERK